MRAIGWIGVLLIVLAVIGFASGGFHFTRERDAAKLGPVSIEVKDREHVRIPPAASAAALAGGLVLVAVGARRRSV